MRTDAIKLCLRQGAVWLLLLTLLGCHHPQALYRAPKETPLEQGRRAEQQHYYARAEDAYRQITDLTVKNMTLNQLSSAWDNVNALIVEAQRFASQDPRSAQAHLCLAQAYYQKGLLCSRYTKGVVGNYPRDFVLDQQDYFFRESLRRAQRALRLDPQQTDASLLIGEIYLANGMQAEALKELKRLIIKHPEYAKGYYAIGKVYLDMKAYDKVERYFIRTIKLDLECIDAYYLLGQFYLEKGQTSAEPMWFELAAKTFLEILRKKPTDSPTFDLLVSACHELGKVYIAREQYGRAMQLLEEVLRVSPSYPVHQSFLLAQKKQKDAMQEQLEAELNPPPGDTSPGQR